MDKEIIVKVLKEQADFNYLIQTTENELLKRAGEIRALKHTPFDVILDDFLNELPDFYLEYIYITSGCILENRENEK